MKNFSKIGVLALLCLASASAQIILTPTTLSVAATTSQRQIVVASATPNASTLDNFAVGTAVIIDNSLGFVTSVSSTTIGINWGSSSGSAVVPHASGSLVWSARANFLGNRPGAPTGSCTRTQLQMLPFVNVNSFIGNGGGTASDCLGGRWVTGPNTQWPAFRVFNPSTGSAVYTGINTNGTTLAATTMYCTEVNLPTPKLLTGIAVLNGTTVGTDKHLVALYDAAGNLLANSAVAGATTAGASVFQEIAFVNTAATPVTGKYYATGPAQYFACMQTNGTTDTVRMAVTGGSADNILTKGVTGVTFGTLAAFTVPTTFTTAVGPYVYLY